MFTSIETLISSSALEYDISLDEVIEDRDLVEFPTRNTYTGQWDKLGMSGMGRYEISRKNDDVIYIGEMYDGQFEGKGTLIYPNGTEIQGLWHMGELIEFTYNFPDELEYNSVDWDYCKMPDRRFYSSIEKGMQPAGRSRKTVHSPTREIPKGCYDTVDGFYDPVKQCVVSAEDPNKIIRIPSRFESTWIMSNCRKAWDEPTGYRPDLYERWITGRNSEFESSTSTPDMERDEISDLISISIPSCRSFHNVKKHFESSVHFA